MCGRVSLTFYNKKRWFFFALLFVMITFWGGTTVSAETSENVVKTATVVSGGRFVTKSAGIKYWYQDGGYAKNVWLKIDGGVYYFDSKGVCQTGWFDYNGYRYYADKTGKIYVKTWKTSGTKTYYLRASGVMAQSQWLKIGGKYYYFNAKGRLVKDKVFSVNGEYYLVNEDGVRMTSCWYTKKNGRICYFMSNGKRAHGKWKKIDGYYYYFDDNGNLVTSQWVGDYYVDENGIRLTNCVVDGYTLDSSGKKTVFTGKYIFVGDCRTVGMSYAINQSNTYFIGEVSMGLIRLKTVASVTLDSYLSTYPNAKVILGYGLNDLYQLDNYISYYKTLISKYPKAQFYIMSINPINETLAKQNGYSVKTSQIQAFNQSMKEAFPDNYLDTYTWLEKNGFSASDGIHYVSSTYVKLYDYIISVIGYN